MTNTDQEALTRATTSQALTNLPTIYREFLERGIPQDDIKPRQNIFTYGAWRALGRQVKRGEKAVCITSWIPISREVTKDGKTETQSRRYAKNAYVFHVSQTKAINSTENGVTS